MAKRELCSAVLIWAMAGCGSDGGGGGPTRCTEASSCDDGIDCTADTCQDVCRHEPTHTLCPGGTVCDAEQGCINPPACASATECPDIGPCSVATCNAATCSYQDLDADGDGQGPESCGGLDCDDTSDDVFSGAPELCNGADDDCDGAIDGLTQACGTDEGECTTGNRTCESGSFSACDGVSADDEACDDLDNDCDGDTDEDFDIGDPCDGPDMGLCDEGVMVCDSLTTTACTDASADDIEVCDGIDNDCDLGTDEGAVCASTLGAWCDPADGSGEFAINPACVGDSRCLDLDLGTNGICVVYECQEDDTSTGPNEDSCRVDYGANYVCVDLQGDADAFFYDNVCLEKCVPSAASNPCQTPFACTPRSTRFNFKDTVCIDLACTAGSDCPVTVTGDMTCMGDGDCLGGGQFCELIYDTDSDGIPDIGACAVPGACDTTNGLCGPHSLGTASASIGDPCQADTDCPDGGYCLTERTYVDSSGVWHRSPRNGYCTVLGCKFAGATGFVCPVGSACNNTFYAGGCMDLCDPSDPTGCRDDLGADGNPTGNGTPCDVGLGITTNCDWYADYDCYDWTGLTFNVNGLPVVNGPDGKICDYLGPVQATCFDFAPTGCPLIAPSGNPEGMQCRYPDTGSPTPTGTEDYGRCLDSTTSGDLCPGFFDLNGYCIP